MEVKKLTPRDVSFGDRLGHQKNLRKAMIKKYGEKEVSELIDFELEKKVLNDGYIPVVISDYCDANETVFLVEKNYLENVIQLKR